MKLIDIKNLTNNFSNINMWISWLKNQPIEKLKRIHSATISNLPKEYQYYLILEKLKKIHNNKYDYSKFTLNWFKENYTNIETQIPIICPQHGEFKVKIKTFLDGKGCSFCRKNNKVTNTNKLSYQDFIEKAERIHGNKYQYPDEDWWNEKYKNNKQKIPIICPIHGEFFQSVISHLSGKGCPICGRRKSEESKKLSYSKFIEKANRIHKNRYTYPFDEDWWNENYKNRTTKIPIICPIHGEFKQGVNSHLLGNGCPICGKEKSNSFKRLSYQDFIEKANQVHKHRYQYLFDEKWWDENYVKRKITKTPIICPIHGEFKQVVEDHLSGCGCPKCFGNYSKGEEELRQFIESLGFKTEKYKDTKYEIDIFIPELKIGFEYNGIYWHSDIFKPKKYHQEKSLYFAEKGITLIHIWEDWWLYKKSIVESFIKQKLGKVEKRIYARKCKVEEVDFHTAKQFLDKNHIDGFASAKLFLALKYNNKIVSLVSLKYWKQEDRWEIDKFANKQGYVIVGGFSKLFKHFIRSYSPQWVTTFSHIDLNNIKENVVYGKNGFKFVYVTNPTYFYFNNNLVRKHRRLFQKKKLLKMFDWATIKMTEREITDKAGLIRVYNAGNFKWEWKGD